MRQPEWYVVPGKEHMVCKLKKSLSMAYNRLLSAGTRPLMTRKMVPIMGRASS